MVRPILFALAIIIGGTFVGMPMLTFTTHGAKAAETMTIKKKKKSKVITNYNRPQPKKKDYYGYPEEPNQASMSNFCAYQYNIYHRRGVGCDRFGHDFMFNN